MYSAVVKESVRCDVLADSDGWFRVCEEFVVTF